MRFWLAHPGAIAATRQDEVGYTDYASRIPDDLLLKGHGLFVSESHNGINTHSFPGRYIRREQRDGQKHERDAGE